MSESELPSYATVTHVRHNVAELALLCRLPDNAAPLRLPVSFLRTERKRLKAE
jgi:hypothetical protein